MTSKRGYQIYKLVMPTISAQFIGNQPLIYMMSLKRSSFSVVWLGTWTRPSSERQQQNQQLTADIMSGFAPLHRPSGKGARKHD